MRQHKLSNWAPSVCPHGKVPHETRDSALAEAKFMNAKRPEDPYDAGRAWEPYRCPQCGEWHIGRRK